MTASKLWKCLYNTPQSLGNATENQSPVEGWAGKHPVFDYLIKLIKPIIIVEVGSWKGQSAITMAKSLDENKIPGAILCIDTWLGSSEHSDTEIFDLKTGQNHLYNAFRSNVVSSGYGQYIVPLARNSIVGAQILEMNQVKADLIYIDASHDYNSVYADIRAF